MHVLTLACDDVVLSRYWHAVPLWSVCGLSVCLSVCLSGTDVHCDHMVQLRSAKFFNFNFNNVDLRVPKS